MRGSAMDNHGSFAFFIFGCADCSLLADATFLSLRVVNDFTGLTVAPLSDFLCEHIVVREW